MLSSEIFLMKTKLTSFKETLKNKKKIMHLIDSSSKILNKLSSSYCKIVGLRTLDNYDKN